MACGNVEPRLTLESSRPGGLIQLGEKILLKILMKILTNFPSKSFNKKIMKNEYVHVSFSNLSSWGYSWGFFPQLNYPPDIRAFYDTEYENRPLDWFEHILSISDLDCNSNFSGEDGVWLRNAPHHGDRAQGLGLPHPTLQDSQKIRDRNSDEHNLWLKGWVNLSPSIPHPKDSSRVLELFAWHLCFSLLKHFEHTCV